MARRRSSSILGTLSLFRRPDTSRRDHNLPGFGAQLAAFDFARANGQVYAPRTLSEAIQS